MIAVVISTYEIPLNDGVFSIDFTTGDGKYFGGIQGHRDMVPVIWEMVAGDGNSDGTIDVSDKDIWSLKAGESGYRVDDFNLNGEVANPDKNEFLLPNVGKVSQVPE